ncbi:MAG: NTP transferase domain-containing protein [Armatimonadota bacterium]
MTVQATGGAGAAATLTEPRPAGQEAGPDQVPAAILAGGTASDKVARVAEAACKALVPIQGRPLVCWVADALLSAQRVSDVVVVEGPHGALSASPDLEGLRIVTAQGPGFIDTLSAAVEAYPEAERVLTATGDLPLLTPDTVDAYVRSCQALQGEVLYPLVRADEFDRVFPGRRKSTVPLREGRFIGANLVMVSRRFVLEEGPTIAQTFARRKSPLGMCRIFGWSFVLRLVLGRLSVADLERRASEMLGATLRAVPAPWPEVAFDVDDGADLELARHYLRRWLEGR